MPITQDGTQRFAIPNSPLNINNVTYIAEDISLEEPSEVVDIEDDEGIPTGQVIIDKKRRLTCTLQLANTNTALPTRGQVFAHEGNNYYVESVSKNEAQKQYAKVPMVAVEQIN
jgi:hypothetical protein